MNSYHENPFGGGDSRIEEPTKIKSATWTLFWGITFAIITLSGALYLASYLIPANFDTIGKYIIYAFLSVIVLKYFSMGIREVPVAHQGVPLLFGTRNKSYRIGEGIFWMPRFIKSAEYIDTRQQTKNVREVPVISKDGVRMAIDTRLMFSITDPYATLSVEEEVVDQGLEDLIVATLRREAKKYSAKDLAIKVATGSSCDDEEINLGGKIEEEAKEISKSWGITTNQVMVTKIIPQDESVIATWEKVNKEKTERTAEGIERNHVIKSVKKMSEELNISESEALMAFDDERDKMHGRRNIVITNANSPMENAAAILSNGLANKE